MDSVMKMPPNRSIGARMAMVWVTCMKDWML